jgi:hypothetical protein
MIAQLADKHACGHPRLASAASLKSRTKDGTPDFVQGQCCPAPPWTSFLRGVKGVPTDGHSLTACPCGQGAAAPLPYHSGIEEVRCPRSGVRYVIRKNGIRNSSRLSVARVIWGEVLYLLTPSHPWFKLPGLHHHVFDGVAPSLALLPVQDHMANCGLAYIGLTRSLEGDRPNQVVAFL